MERQCVILECKSPVAREFTSKDPATGQEMDHFALCYEHKESLYESMERMG